MSFSSDRHVQIDRSRPMGVQRTGRFPISSEIERASSSTGVGCETVTSPSGASVAKTAPATRTTESAPVVTAVLIIRMMDTWDTKDTSFVLKLYRGF